MISLRRSFALALALTGFATHAIANTTYPDPFDYNAANLKKWMPRTPAVSHTSCRTTYRETWVRSGPTSGPRWFSSIAAAARCTSTGGRINVLRRQKPLSAGFVIDRDLTIAAYGRAGATSQKAVVTCRANVPCFRVARGATFRLKNIELRQAASATAPVVYIDSGTVHLSNSKFVQGARYPNIVLENGRLRTSQNEFLGGSQIILVPHPSAGPARTLTMREDKLRGGVDGIVIGENASATIISSAIERQLRHGIVVGGGTLNATDNEITRNGTDGSGFGLLMTKPSSISVSGNKLFGNRGGGLSLKTPPVQARFTRNHVKCSPVVAYLQGRRAKRLSGFKKRCVPWSFVSEKKKRYRKTCRQFF